MKKSELELKIQVLLESRGYVGNGDDGKAVVDLLEKVGMLPPSVRFKIGDITYTDNVWEKEDAN